MSTTLAPTATAVAFHNPLDLDAPADRIEAAVTAMIDSAVGAVEDEIRAMIRRREVAAAVRSIRRVKAQLDEIRDGVPGVGLAGLASDGYRADLIGWFKVVNPAAGEAAVAGVVDAFLGSYQEAKKKGKS